MKDVVTDDLMKVTRLDKKSKPEPLPQMVRDYILHDRGNSLYLGDSFGNLPSPVAESETIRRLFKFSEDEKDIKRKSRDQQIKVEGKNSARKDVPKVAPNRDFKVDLKELNKIVFEETKVK